ncbi:MAG: type I secretion system permease/ATPase [Pseudomonadota bacterium]
MEHNTPLNSVELFTFLGYLYWPALVAVLISTLLVNVYTITLVTSGNRALLSLRSTVAYLDRIIFVGLLCIFFCISAFIAGSLSFKVFASEIGLTASFAIILYINAVQLRRFQSSVMHWGHNARLADHQIVPFAVSILVFISCWIALLAFYNYIEYVQKLPTVTMYTALIAVWGIFATTLTLTLQPGKHKGNAHGGYHNHKALNVKQAHNQGIRAHSFFAQPSVQHFNKAMTPYAPQQYPHMQPSRGQNNFALSRGLVPQNNYNQRPAGSHFANMLNQKWPRILQSFDPKRKKRSLQKASHPGSNAQTDQHSYDDVWDKCRDALGGALVISMFSNILMLTGPLFMLQVYDRVLTSGSVPTLTALFTLVIALFIFMGLLDIIRSRVLVRVGVRVDKLLSKQVFDRAVGVRGPAEGGQQTQLLKDLRQVRSFVGSPAMASIFDMPWAPFYFLIVFLLHWALGFLAVVGAIILVILALVNEFMSQEPVAKATRENHESDSVYESGRRNSEILQAMGMANAFRDRWLNKHHAGLTSNTVAADISGSFSVITKVLRLFLQSAMLAAGAYFVLQGEMSPGAMIAGSIIMSRGLAPIEQAVGQWRNFVATRQSMGRLQREFKNPPPEQNRIQLPTPRGYLVVENMFAAPVGTKMPILKGLNFHLEPGDALGVLGQSGSGKSTLAKVLVGVCPTLRGSVRLDSSALENWPPEQLGKHVGYLPQNAELFNGTVAENISRFTSNATPQAIIEAARYANVHELIASLPEGYNTRVGESGLALSGGQRQRIALARALYGAPALIVLDEPNSNLDKSGEEALGHAILAMRRMQRTFIIMAHRPNVLENVNKIMVLTDGRQDAFGPKDKILKPKKVPLTKTKPKLINESKPGAISQNKTGGLKWKQK